MLECGNAFNTVAVLSGIGRGPSPFTDRNLKSTITSSLLLRRCRLFSSKRSTLSFKLLAGPESSESTTQESLVDKVASKGIWQFGALPQDAQDALAKTGWIEKEESEAQGTPTNVDFDRSDINIIVERAVADETFADERSKEMFTEDTREKLMKEILRREIRAEQGVELEDLLNPIKVVNLELKILKLESALAAAPGGEERQRLEAELSSKRADLAGEKRAVMRDWLKALFRGQAAVSLVVGGALAFDAVPLVDSVPIAARALGFWTLWLFTIPSLRAVKPLGVPGLGLSAEAEKKALNLAFVLTPLLTLALPFATKDPGLIFAADTAVLAACYLLYKALPPAAAAAGPSVEITGVLKYLDYGSGRERGARK